MNPISVGVLHRESNAHLGTTDILQLVIIASERKNECPLLKSKKGFSTWPATSAELAVPLSSSRSSSDKNCLSVSDAN